MKIMICGKGGCGKSTFSVLLAKAFSRIGIQVLLVDADESNFGIPHLLGIESPMHLMDSFGGKKGFKEKLNSKFPANAENGVFVTKHNFDELPVACVASADGIRVVSIGKIHHFGEGCACPMGMLSKKFLGNLVTRENEIVIIDSEAGVEHFGRGVVGEIDVIIGLVDPTAESFMLAGKMREMAESAGKEALFVLNKVEPAIEPVMRKHLEENSIIGAISQDNALFMASLEGRSIESSPVDSSMDAVDEIARELSRK